MEDRTDGKLVQLGNDDDDNANDDDDDNAFDDDDDSKVEDRTDGKLVHLDGLNFSRAWALYRFPLDS